MSSKNGDFRWADSVDLKDYFNAKLEAVMSLIESNDKNYNQRFESGLTAVNAALAAADRAVQKAEVASEKRFDAVNEFRATLADQQRTLMPRAEVEITMKSINEKIDNITNKLDVIEGKGFGVKDTWGYLFGLAGVIIAITAILVKIFMK